MGLEDINMAALVLMSQTMLEKAQTGEWDDVKELENERRVLLEQFFDADELTDEVATIQIGIQTIQQLDRRLMDLGQQKKIELSKLLQGFNQGKKAVKAYLN
ncbi:MAG: flagellar protein FliT [Methylococcales bacterium]|nr:flagellar protein FliT [Methylococcales bacterium]